MKRWVVREGEAHTVADVLAAMNEDERAVTDGRVFVGRQRVQNTSDAVRAGDVVTVGAVPATSEVRVLARAKGVIAVDKPAGIPTIADHTGRAHSLHGLVARRVGLAPDAVRTTSRLDRGVSGVVIFTTSDPAATALREAREHSTYKRRYVALASRAPDPPEGTWDAPIGHAKDPRLRAARGRDAAPSTTRYRTVAVASGVALLDLEPVTGRTHQIRVHAADAGCPLLGDRDYGGPARTVLATGKVLALSRVALHCAHVTTPLIEARADVPEELRALWRALGGDDTAWA
jgi:23S rRNA-/tRNA-specific pseudouridylate synthase